jgi:hypothetical protein
MSDQEKKEEPTSITPQPDAENKKESGELSEEELKNATGGAVSDYMKQADAASKDG